MGLTAQLQTNFLFKSQTQTDVRKSSRKQGLETFCSEIIWVLTNFYKTIHTPVQYRYHKPTRDLKSRIWSV